jgi:hypothetical protein
MRNRWVSVGRRRRAAGGEDHEALGQEAAREQHDLGAELEQTFGPGKKPTCTLIPAPRLALDGMLFEVEAVAVLRG